MSAADGGTRGGEIGGGRIGSGRIGSGRIGSGRIGSGRITGRVLIADDSAFMRIALRRIIESEAGLSVVGEARNGAEAIDLARTLQPDIVTMDVEMKGMDGLDAVRGIMAGNLAGPAIIMVSSHTQDDTDATVQALRFGAVDWVSKSSALARQDLAHIDSTLRAKLRLWAAQPRAAHPPPPPPAPAVPGARAVDLDLVVVVCSTGGPGVLPVLLGAAGRLPVPMVIAQHMPPRYTASLAAILRADTGLDVTEGTHRMPLLPGSVVVIPGGLDGAIGPGAGGLELRLLSSAAPVHPNGDVLFTSAALVARAPVGVILTGMGSDGTAGARKLRERNRPVLVQDPASCIVDGMPGAALDAGAASEALSVAGIGRRLAGWTGA